MLAVFNGHHYINVVIVIIVSQVDHLKISLSDEVNTYISTKLLVDPRGGWQRLKRC